MGGERPHSVPLSAACANTFLRDFLLFSKAKRAASCKVSLVLKLWKDPKVKGILSDSCHSRISII